MGTSSTQHVLSGHGVGSQGESIQTALGTLEGMWEDTQVVLSALGTQLGQMWDTHGECILVKNL